jgi:hypothetical protein
MPKRAVLLLPFLFLVSICFARKHDHFQAGVSFMPALVLDKHFQYDVFKLSYAAGLQMYYGGKKLSFNTGIHYLHLVDQSDFLKYTRQRDVSSYITGFDSTISETKFFSRNQLLGIPLITSLVLGNGKTKFNLEAGMQISYLIEEGEKTIYHYKDGTERTFSYSGKPYQNTFYIAPILRFGILRSLPKDLLIKALPEISWQFSNRKETFWLVGIQFIVLKSFL